MYILYIYSNIHIDLYRYTIMYTLICICTCVCVCIYKVICILYIRSYRHTYIFTNTLLCTYSKYMYTTHKYVYRCTRCHGPVTGDLRTTLLSTRAPLAELLVGT